jgi:cytochrome c2
MKYFLTACIVCLITILSCNTSKEKNLVSLLNLPSKQYTINVERDTTFQTEKGALLKIPKGALKPENGNSVTLEIKEAYSLADMIKAGLFTQADGKPLSSGGMIYIDAAKGQKVSFTQPIQVAIPADYLQDGMQLYKGDESNGKINWKNPAALIKNKQLASIDSGQILFQANCASCHAIGQQLTAPDLANLLRRPHFGEEGGFPWLHEWGLAHEDSYSKTDSSNEYDHYSSHLSGPYYCNLRKIFGGMIGPPSSLNNRELQKIITYIQNESDRRRLPFPAHAYLDSCIDSCYAYKERVVELEKQKTETTEQRKKLIEENGPLVDFKGDSTWPVGNPIKFEEKVSPENFEAVYYQFTVDSFGWLNVDMLLNEIKGVEESELFVKVTGDYKEKVNTFLIIPSVKTYAEGGPADRNHEEFAYYLKNGKIPLPQNVEAYILAVSESEQSPAFGLKKFTTGRQQEIEISLHAATKDEFTEAMKEFDAARLHIKVADTKNAGEIRKTDTTIRKIDEQIKDAEKLKPKRCDCDCGFPDVVTKSK